MSSLDRLGRRGQRQQMLLTSLPFSIYFFAATHSTSATPQPFACDLHLGKEALEVCANYSHLLLGQVKAGSPLVRHYSVETAYVAPIAHAIAPT